MPAAAEAGTDAPPAFLPARPITQADLAALTERVRRRVIRWFRMQRLLDAAAAADMLAWENSGFSIDAFRPDHTSRPRCAQLLSESRTSSGPAAAGSPRGREPMASSNSRRLSFSILWRTSSRRRGSTGIATTGCLRRITSSGPPSRRMRKGNIGKRREAVTGGHAAGGRATAGCCDANPNQKPRSHDTSRIAWAKLMARVREEFPLECPNCGGDIRLRADGRQEPAPAK